VTPELKELELAISTRRPARALERSLYEELVERIAARCDDLLQAAEALAEIDVLAALAQSAAERGYVRPALCEESEISIQDGRHP